MNSKAEDQLKINSLNASDLQSQSTGRLSAEESNLSCLVNDSVQKTPANDILQCVIPQCEILGECH